jgi:ATP-dependent helicase/nuclease subunit A
MPQTKSQAEAVAARGNIIVVAGAGTGKTTTLVERCVALVAAGCSIENILMVTFTDAAAAEMRHRLRLRLGEAVVASRGEQVEWWQEQLALLDTARICTLHSFCLQLVRENFHLLGIDPAVRILDDQQSRPLIEAALGSSLAPHYAGAGEASERVRELIRRYGQGDVDRIRALMLKLHRHAQSLPDPRRWFEDQLASFSSPDPAAWRGRMATEISDWAKSWFPELEPAAGSAPNLARCAQALADLSERQPGPVLQDAMARILAADDDWPARQKTRLRAPFAKFFEETAFLASQFESVGDADGLAVDWSAVREPMLALVDLAREFGEHYAVAKRELGGVDFQDLEQFALNLLWNDGSRLTAVAEELRSRFAHVFVDECQDINAAQDAVLRAVSREGDASNRFLVGDVKQSIYQFRLARPELFRKYEKDWADGRAGRRIPLADNFRSDPKIIRFVNRLFETLMRDDVGGVQYEALAPGRTDAVNTPEGEPSPALPVEFHLIPKGGPQTEESGENGDEPPTAGVPEDLDAVEREARLVAMRLRELRESGLEIWDKETRQRRRVEWRDMAVLLRAPGARVEAFAKEFHKCGVPLHAERGGFLESSEINDLLSVLRLLDNPLQDIPLLAVLRSPMVALTLDEMAEVRAASGARRFWLAIKEYLQSGAGRQTRDPGTMRGARQKLDWLVQRFAVWRELARKTSLSECLEQVLEDTHYVPLVMAGERGPEHVANIRKFVETLRQYDPYQRQGLSRFLNFIRSVEDAGQEIEPAPVQAQDAVRLMSIHKSKGLEFSVVVVACLGARFNVQDLGSAVLLDRDYGLCAKAVQPGNGARHPTMAHWLAARRQRQRLWGEELRLFYVAATRARDRLILTATAARKDGEMWEAVEPRSLSTNEILKARSALDWLMLWLPMATRREDWDGDGGVGDLLSWRICLGQASSSNVAGASAQGLVAPGVLAQQDMDPAVEQVKQRIRWVSPHATAATVAAKTSVSALRRQAADLEDEDAKRWHFGRYSETADAPVPGAFNAAELGSLHHRFLQHISLSGACDAADLQIQSDAMMRRGVFNAAEAVALDLAPLAAFWQADVGAAIRAHAASVRRELPFTARFTPVDLERLTGMKALPGLQDEFVVVQGVADLVVLLPEELWLLDYKTDAVSSQQVDERAGEYRPQLTLYAAALEAIYRRPVTRRWLHFLKSGITVTL